MNVDERCKTRPDEGEKVAVSFEKAAGGIAAIEPQHKCEFCGRCFASRNLIFKHLRDAASGSCGTAILESNQAIPNAPSSKKKEQHKAAVLEAAKARRRNKTGQTARHTQHCLWIGNLPLSWTRHGGNYKRFRALLRAHLPRTVPQPWIKVVNRKGYRTKLMEDENRLTTGGGVYLGYAIVVFRDDQECEIVLRELDGREISVDSVFSMDDLESNADFASLAESGVPPFAIKVRPVQNNTANQQRETNGVPIKTTPAGRDPPWLDQLRPLSTDELLARAKRLVGDFSSTTAEATSASNANVPLSLDEQHERALERAVAAYNDTSRPELRRDGCLIPDKIRDKLLTILQSLRWAVPNHRPGLTAERYLVLLTSVTNDLFYQDLREACRGLVDWADPSYYYSGIAVTKNFVSSPHIDDRDRSFQYAVSLGDFCTGGELCVDGLDCNGQEVIHVVNTHDRISRVDGRHVHWVRTWEGGDRYSLIFYDTSDRNPTPVMGMGVDDALPVLQATLVDDCT
jgi:hypothetical protein